MNRCKTCRFWEPPKEPYREIKTEQKTCVSPQVVRGYGGAEVPEQGIRVEDDEGWALLTGPDFGCVNYVPWGAR